MKKTLLTVLKYVVFLGLGIWIVYHMLHQLTPEQKDELISAIESINPWYLVPITIAGVLSHVFRAVRWRYLLETVDCRPTVLNTTFSVFIGYIANLALPRAGEVAKCTVLAKYENLPAHKMIGTIVAERAFDVLCLIVITIFAFGMQAHIISEYLSVKMDSVKDKIEALKPLLFGGLAAFALLIVIVVIIYRRNKDSKVGRLMKEMLHGILSIIHMKKRWQFMIFTVLIWAMYLAQIYIGLLCLPATHHLSILTALVVLVYGSLGMIATPGGIGAYTYLVAQILGLYMIADVPAQAFGWIAWVVQTAIIIVFGVASLILIHPLNRNRDAQIAVDTE